MLRAKSNLIIILIAIMCVCLAGLTACGGKEGEKKGENGSAVISATSVEIGIDKVGLVEIISDGKPVKVEWTSANPEIATVNEYGNVIPVSVGETEISAIYKGETYRCAVKVLISTDFPYLDLGRDKVELIVGKSFKLSDPQVLFKGEGYDVDCDYSIADESIATISEDGTITTLQDGVTTLTVKAQYGDNILERVISLNVKADVMITLSKSSLSLYTVSTEPSQETQDEVTASLYINGQVVTDGSLTWKSYDQNVAAVSDGVITAVGKGNTRVAAVFESESGAVYENYVQVTVSPIKFEVDLGIEVEANGEWDISQFSGVYADFFDVPVTDVTLLNHVSSYSFTQDECVLTVDTGSDILAGDCTVTIGTSKVEIETTVFAVTKIIRTVNDFKNMQAYGGLTQEAFDAGQRYYEGYFVLGNDIDFGGGDNGWIKRLGYSYNVGSNNGFSGTFDGRGHTISNVVLNEIGGLFGSATSVSVIKNVAFTGITLSCRGGIIGQECCAELENVFIDATFTGASDAGALAYYTFSSHKNGGIKDVVIVAHGTAGDGSSVLGNLFELGSSGVKNVTNSYIVTNGVTMYYTAGETAPSTVALFTTGETGVTATGLSETYWDLSGDYPVFK